ncbi:hypothetical protein [Nocardia asiatica]|uniref:hypothetical protein n=1 Tax=Nocardia asiatica TaxID=209252 RepID=UPI0002FABFE1|nr:hypothetical protein [Nocardia asiatica]
MQSIWYQHAVGHGLLIAANIYRQLGGLPHPRYGLEDAALGVTIREVGLNIHPFSTLECGDAPRSARELQRQRSTWIRGPLCSAEYARTRRGRLIAAQGTYGGLKWAFGLPAQALALAVLRPHQRAVATTGWLLALYGPLIRMLTDLHCLDFPSDFRPSRHHTAVGLAFYPVAAASCWAGGVRGVVLLCWNILHGRAPIQLRTREAE